MFGSLRITTSRLSTEEHEAYRGHFCGSCHAMREFSGRWTSLLTNYDQTVLSLVLGGLEGCGTSFAGCTAVPFRKVPVAELSAASRTFVAALNLALVDAKLIDDVADDDGRLVKRAGRRVLRRKTQQAYGQLQEIGFATGGIESVPDRQAEIEKRRHPSLDQLADPSAQLTADIFAFAARLTGRSQQAPALQRFGTALGRFVYTWDAWVDRDDDRRRRRFNAIDAALGDGPDDAGSQVASVTLYLNRQINRLEQCLGEIQLGIRGAVLGHLLASMRTRVAHQVEAGAPRSAEAGDCDCASAPCECGECGLGGGEGAGICHLCTCCEACDACLCWSTRAKDRRQERQAKRAAKTILPTQE